MSEIFRFGQIVEKKDICNRTREIKLLNSVVNTTNRAIVYGRRRFGKTSVVRNVIMEDFLKNNKNSIAIYCDLFQLKSQEDFLKRLEGAFSRAFSRLNNLESIVSTLKGYLRGMSINFDIDPLTGLPNVKIAFAKEQASHTIGSLFQTIHEISKKYKFLLVFDEFQDIVNVESLEPILRTEFQNLTYLPIIVLGSRRHVLLDMFSSPKRPFYGFGMDVYFDVIERKDWMPFIQKRFLKKEIIIKEKEINIICELMLDVPNSIQELCHWISENHKKKTLDKKDIGKHLSDLLKSKSSKFNETLGRFSEKERRFIINIAKEQPVKEYQGKKFLKKVDISSGGSKAIANRLLEQGVLDQDNKGLLVTDVLFAKFLEKYL